MTVFLSFISLFSFNSTAAAKTAPDEIPAGIPSHFAKTLENSKAELLLICKILSIILTSNISGTNPAPIPCIK